MLMLVVVLIFAAALVVIWSSACRVESKPRPILLHRDEHSLHHQRNLPGPGAD